MSQSDSQGRTEDSPSAPGAQACQSCRTSKAKCVREGNAAKCARCSRLQKECISVARIQRKKRAPHVTRTAQLEQKLQGLVELLAAQQNVPQQQASPSTETSQPSQAFTPTTSTHAAPDPPLGYSPALMISQPAALYTGRRDSHRSNANNENSPDFSPADSAFDDISPAEAAFLLNRYQNKFAKQLPFVVIEPRMTAEELHKKKPFLLRNIILVASYDNPLRQRVMGREIMKELSSAMFLNFHRDLALLQGTLICAAWNHFHGNLQMQGINLVHLALAIVYTLDLHKPLPPPDKTDPYDELVNTKGGSSTSARKSHHTLEEQRAFLGCFYCCSVVAVCFRKMDSMRLTPYVEMCCQNLLSARQYPSDLLLVNQVRLQCIVETMDLTAVTQAFPERGLTSNIISRTFLKELDAYGASQARDLERDQWLHVAFHRAYIQLNEPAIHKPVVLSAGAQTIEHLDMLYACLNSTKVFFTTFFQIPPTSYCYMTIFNYSQLAYGLATLFRLTLLETSGWDIAQVRATIDIMYVTEKVAQNLAIGTKTLDPTNSVDGTDAASRVGRQILLLRTWLEAKLLKPQEQNLPSQFEAGMGPPGLGVDGMDIFDAVDETFWQNFMVL